MYKRRGRCQDRDVVRKPLNRSYAGSYMKIEANANDYRLGKLPKLSEWSCE
jgi:hypothetical protein